MTPDPKKPRDLLEDGDSNGEQGPNFPTGVMDDEEEMMFVDGPHELDDSSDGGSDDVSSDDAWDVAEEHNVPATENVVRRTAQYRMLIPFEVVESTQASQPLSSEDDVTSHTGQDESNTFSNLQPQNSDTIDVSSVTSDQAEHSTIREIQLTEEKLDSIKNAMKNFTIPDSSIPFWAKELDEQSWKSKLVEKIEAQNKSSDSKS